MTTTRSTEARSSTTARNMAQLCREIAAARDEACTLAQFVRRAWCIVEPHTPYVHNWHIEALCELLESVSRGDTQRLIVNVPPGTMKSLLVSVFWPAWEWAERPGLRYLAASYGSDLSRRDNLRLRGVIASPWYRDYCGLRLVEDQNTKRRVNTAAGGWRIATSVGGVGTGEHPDRIIIDDPITAANARSLTERQAVLDWFTQTVSTRGVARDSRTVVVMQRFHEQDLAGHLLNMGSWRHVCFPMRFEPERSDPCDVRTEAGELLWPALFPEAAVRQLERDLGPYGTAGQLQQRPAPQGGGLFKREWFEIVDAAAIDARRCRAWDTASTEAGGDYTAGVRMAKTTTGLYFIEHVYRAQKSAHGVDVAIRSLASSDGTACLIREEQEPGSSGKAVIEARRRVLAGHDYGGDRATGDKVVRAGPLRSQAEGGNVKLVRGDWNEELLQELESFPYGAHDDQVDAAALAFNTLAEPPKKVKRGGTFGRAYRRDW